MDNYAVIGNPIAHSLSPRIHGLFAAQTGQALSYRAIFSRPGEFSDTVEAFRQAGGRGLNVTLPFKEQAWEYVNDNSARADRVRAVNLIRFDGPDRVHGDSTDGVGLIRDLTGNEVQIRQQRVLLVGAGGAVRSVLGSLIDEQPASMTIINRTRSRAEQLLELFPEARGMFNAQGFDEPAGGPYDLVVNGTSAGLAGQPFAVTGRNTGGRRLLLRHGLRQGSAGISGLGRKQRRSKTLRRIGNAGGTGRRIVLPVARHTPGNATGHRCAQVRVTVIIRRITTPASCPSGQATR